VLPAVHSESSAATQAAPTHAVELAHSLAFRNGLGHSLYADSHATGSITADDVRDLHTRAVSNPSNVAILGTGISTESLAKHFESVFAAHHTKSSTTASTPAPATIYHGGSTRVASAHGGPQALFIGFGSTKSTSVPALHALAAHLNPVPALKWASSVAPWASAIPAGVYARSVLLPYSDATLIGVVLEGTDGAALKEGAKAVVAAFRDAAVPGKVGAEVLARAVARARFQLAAGVEARDGYVGAFGPAVLRGEKTTATVTTLLDGVQAVSAASLSQVRATHIVVSSGDHTICIFFRLRATSSRANLRTSRLETCTRCRTQMRLGSAHDVGWVVMITGRERTDRVPSFFFFVKFNSGSLLFPAL
jgi:ubiquinol-cytochrome c reductase core subunit 2